MTRQEEQYIHFVSCINNLNEAWRILQIIKQSNDNPLIGPAFQFALIEYSKPYFESRGVVKTNHRLGLKHIPTRYHGLHNEILTARKQLHAHSDLTVQDARVFVTNTDYGKHVGTASSVCDSVCGPVFPDPGRPAISGCQSDYGNCRGAD